MTLAKIDASAPLRAGTANGQPCWLGEDVESETPIETSVYSRIYDYTTKARTGTLRLRGYRTVREVYKQLQAKLDIVRCTVCPWSVPRKPSGNAEWCPECASDTEWLIDEYVSLDGGHIGGYADKPCGPYWRMICFPVTGANEGHYIHVGAIYSIACGATQDGYRDWMTIKTWRGMDGAFDMCRRIVDLLDI